MSSPSVKRWWLAPLITTILCGSALGQQRSAKDMYFNQLGDPAQCINTGFKYWIQLHRKGATTLVDNRATFLGGDEIAFQIIPNITGYAYVVLAHGSTGAQKVLFPNSREPNGKVVAGQRYLLPTRGLLRFDQNPGIETVRIVISRHPVSQSALLSPDSSNWVHASNDAARGKPIQSKNCLLTNTRQSNSMPRRCNILCIAILLPEQTVSNRKVQK